MSEAGEAKTSEEPGYHHGPVEMLLAAAITRRSRPSPAPKEAAASRFGRAVSSSSSSQRAAAAAATPPHSTPALDVLYEDKHLIVVNKPAGLLSQGAIPSTSSTSSTRAAVGPTTDMLTLVRTYLTAAAGKPPSKPVYLGLVHRLDRNVSGAMVFAKRSKAAARLSEAFRTRAVRKMYVAAVLGAVRGEKGRAGEARTLRHLLAFSTGKGKDKGKDNVTRVVGDAPAAADGGDGSSGGDGVVGTLRYTPLLVFPHPQRAGEHETVLRVELVSGRKHQIRAQLSHIGHPIVGDVKYGAPAGLRDRSIALHCRTLAFAHPKREQREGGGGEEGPEQRMVVVDAPLPSSWAARFGDVVVATVESVKG